MKILAKRLREARDDAGYNQIEASKILVISNGTLSGYERDYRDPDTEILHKMSNLYDVSVDWLVGNTDNRKVTINEELERILKDPQTNLMFNDWQGMDEEQRQEALRMIKFILYKDETKKRD